MILHAPRDVLEIKEVVRSTPWLTIPHGGRAWLTTVRVCPLRWNNAIVRAAPQTPEHPLHLAREMEECYPLRFSVALCREVVIVWFGNREVAAAKVFAWRSMYGFRAADPRVIFAIAEQQHLELVLGSSPLALIASAECSLGRSNRLLPYVLFHNGKRRVCARWIEQHAGTHDYFVFLCE